MLGLNTNLGYGLNSVTSKENNVVVWLSPALYIFFFIIFINLIITYFFLVW